MKLLLKYSRYTKLRPFGTDFNSPTFEVNDLNVKSIKAIGQEGKHLKSGTWGESISGTLLELWTSC